MRKQLEGKMDGVASGLEILLKPEEVSLKLQIGLSTVYHLAHRGELPGAVKIGGALRVVASVLDKALKDAALKGYKVAA